MKKLINVEELEKSLSDKEQQKKNEEYRKKHKVFADKIKSTNKMTESKSLEYLIEEVDKEMDKKYGYGLSKPNSFGYEATKKVIKGIWSVLDKEKITDVEELSKLAHTLWGIVAETFDDPIYKENPKKKENRLKLANTSYKDLPEDEKEKDRTIVKKILELYNK